MSILRSLFVKLGLDVDAQSFAKGALAVEGVKAILGKAVDKAVELGREFVHQVEANARYAAALDETSQAIGVGTAALQELGHAAQMSGSNADEMNFTMRMLTRTLRMAKEGNDEVSKSFAKLGVKTTDASGKIRNADEVFAELAEGLSKLPDGTDKTALAMRVLGNAGGRMIPLLNEGRAGIERLREEARELGLVMDDGAIKAGAELDDTLDRLKATTTGLWRSAIAPMLPAISDLVKRFLAWRQANAGVIRQNMQRVMGAMLAAVRVLGSALSTMIRLIDSSIKSWKALAIVLGPAVLYATVKAAIGYFATLSAAAVGAALAAMLAWAAALAPIAALVLLIEDMQTYQKAIDEGGTGINTIFGRFMQGSEMWKKPFQNLFDWISGKKTIWQAVTDGWKEAFDRFVDYLEGAWASRVKRLFDSIGVNKARSLVGLAPLGLQAAPSSSIPAIDPNFMGPPPRAFAPTSTTSTSHSREVHAPITVVQQPGQDGKALADIVKGHIETLLEDANASQPVGD